MLDNLWIEEKDNTVRIGVNEVFQEEAGDIAYVSIADLGEIKEEDTLFNVEAAKAAIEVPSPFSGQVVARNDQAELKPSMLNSTEKEDNWVVEIQRS